METRLAPAGDPASLAQAAALLQAGALVAFPTDTVYGVGALAWHEQGVARLYTAKGRPEDKAIPLLLASAADLSAIDGLMAGPPSPLVQRLAQRFWPGPLTLVVPSGWRVPPVITAGGNTVAVRVPDHPVTLRLLALLGAPLAATSANLSGQPDSLTAQDVLAQLRGRVDLVLDGGACPGGLASTVVDVTCDPPRILRPGPVSLQVLEMAAK